MCIAETEPRGFVGRSAGVAAGGVFEGDGSFYVGLDAEWAYRITLLEQPTRVVIDIAND
ncbi:AMIN-like domain-containing (lipo)protein [Georgenia faecalis]|uniref:AMIN-like domain-containing (lipo)protein n=1 Tax=Georgenia faecalis TaxID=2483799 RepID=UPI003B96E951